MTLTSRHKFDLDRKALIWPRLKYKFLINKLFKDGQPKTIVRNLTKM